MNQIPNHCTFKVQNGSENVSHESNVGLNVRLPKLKWCTSAIYW